MSRIEVACVFSPLRTPFLNRMTVSVQPVATLPPASWLGNGDFRARHNHTAGRAAGHPVPGLIRIAQTVAAGVGVEIVRAREYQLLAGPHPAHRLAHRTPADTNESLLERAHCAIRSVSSGLG